MAFSFLEKRRAERAGGTLPIAIRGKMSPSGWTEHVQDGGAIILDISDTGLKMSGGAVHEIGTLVRIAVPGADAGGAEFTVDAKVVWAKRNDIPRFGRWSCGLAFSPEAQPGIPLLRAAHWALNRKPSPPGGAAA